MKFVKNSFFCLFFRIPIAKSKRSSWELSVHLGDGIYPVAVSKDGSSFSVSSAHFPRFSVHLREFILSFTLTIISSLFSYQT